MPLCEGQDISHAAILPAPTGGLLLSWGQYANVNRTVDVGEDELTHRPDLFQPYVPLFAEKIVQDLRRQFVALLCCLLQEGLALTSLP